METVEEIVTELNKALKTDNLSKERAVTLLEPVKGKLNIEIKMVDLTYYNESTLLRARDEKIIGVKTQNFEWSASQRNLEQECVKYIDLKKQLRIRKSMFYFEENNLLYFYLGKKSNDKLFKELLIGCRL